VLKVSEVYDRQTKVIKERPDGSEYTSFENIFDTRDILINERFIVSVRPHEFESSAGISKMEAAFPGGTKFSTIIVDGNSFRKSEILVVGSFERFCATLQGRET
jgi:hypothetical protein|tara:strand:- start:803 stop:1114 length:312 start_codon:yes stop_codon:yes gene_type:complete